MYIPHPGSHLNRVFAARPFQGAEPESAKFLFIGLDANYAPDIESSPIFPQMLAYLEDGVSFWRAHGVHHPFLLPSYQGDGRFYHASFANIGFRPGHANLVSFIELLHLPTCGRSALTPADLSTDHLTRINNAILFGTAQHIFIPDSVARLMRETGVFSWLPRNPKRTDPANLGLWFERGAKRVYWHYHLSVYGKFNAAKAGQLRQIGSLIDPARES